MVPLPENTDFPDANPITSQQQHQSHLGPMYNNNNNNNSEDDIATSKNATVDGIYLRWSRVTKTVVLKTENDGLLKGSIADKQQSDNNNNNNNDPRKSFSQQLSKAARSSYSQLMMKQQPKPTKNILNEVSGYAAPGEILAMMG